MRKVLKWFGIGVGSLLGLALVVVLGLAARGRARLNHTYQVSGLVAAAVADSLTVASGEHVAQIHGCRGCHGI